MNVATMLLSVARQFATCPAVTADGRTWSYGEFGTRVGAIAGSFRRSGLVAGDRVLLCMENCGEFLEVLFACWTAGVCAVPVNAKLHSREIMHIASDARPRIIVTTPGLVHALGEIEQSLEGLEALICTQTSRYDRLIAGDPIEPVDTAPNDAAWLFYTSGTTGRPKGAILSHRTLISMSLSYYADVDAVDETDTKFHAAPLSHGSGLYALPHMLKGSHQVVMPSFDVDLICETLGHYRNVTMFTAPTMLTRLVNSPSVSKIDPGRIRTIYYGGGPMYVTDLDQAIRTFGKRLFHLYGQAEAPMTIAGLGKSRHPNLQDPDAAELLTSCGVARTGTMLRVVDDQGRSLPPGLAGEVVTRSDCVMQGYWNNPAATAAALRGGWLWTGDIGSLSASGYLTLRDRSKDMIISGGSNIYPRELEEVLLRHPFVSEVSVVGRPHPDWGEEVVAFVVTKAGCQVPEHELDQLCLQNLARFKRPKLYRFVEELPKNNYGKVLKTGLRRMLEEETA